MAQEDRSWVEDFAHRVEGLLQGSWGKKVRSPKKARRQETPSQEKSRLDGERGDKKLTGKFRVKISPHSVMTVVTVRAERKNGTWMSFTTSGSPDDTDSMVKELKDRTYNRFNCAPKQLRRLGLKRVRKKK